MSTAKSIRSYRSAVMATASLAAMFAASGAAAQTAQQGGAAVAEEIVVTGTRVIRDGYEAPTPVSVLGAEELNAMAVTNIADAVNRLPSFGAGLTSRNTSGSVSGGIGGLNLLNLRSLGATRTLVLLDGRRVVGANVGGNSGSAVDINGFPNGLISRIDVVTGGASAAYGSDAVAGVVNFVVDKEFTGIKGVVDTGITTYGDDAQYRVSLSAGSAFAGGRGHVLLSGEHAFENGIKGQPRKWSDRTFVALNNPSYTATNGQPQLLALEDIGLGTATGGGLILSCAGYPGTTCPLRGTQFLQGGTPAPFRFGLVSGNTMSGGDFQMSRVDKTSIALAQQMERENIFARVSYDLADNVTVFADTIWAYSKAWNPGATSNINFGGINIRNDNPFIPASIRAQMTALGITQFTMGNSNQYDMPLLQSLNARTFRSYVLGVEGNFNAFDSDWNWDASWAKSTNHLSFRSPGNRINANYLRATDATTDASGKAVCRVNADADPANDDPRCIPFNPMGIGVNADNTYVYGTGYGLTKLSQDVWAVNANGEPFSTWAGPVSLALGGEHRKEGLSGIASSLDLAAAYFAGNFGASTGSYTVTEGYLETVIPLAKDAEWAKKLDLNAAARFTDYSTSGFVVTWKAGATFSPIDDLTFRGTVSRDIRAPNVGDLFTSDRPGTGTVIDPRNGSSSFIVTSVRGNRALQPEKADAIGVGAVFQPSFLPGFNASVDYYDINVKDAIASLSAQNYVDRCHDGTAPALCSFITRDAAGNITFVAVVPANILSQSTRGMDIEASYTLPLSTFSDDWDGEFRLRGLATKVFSLKTVDSLGTIEGAGIQADGGVIGLGSALQAPKFRYLLSGVYDNGPFSATVTMRGIGSGVFNTSFITCTSGCPAATAAHPTINLNYVPSVTYFDLAFDYDFMDGMLQPYFTAENVFDKDPPLVVGTRGAGFYAGQGNTGLYDRLGRVFRAGVRFKM
ncbi:MAG: TonB-dependent receptor [Rhodospirillaceae bacterium]|nr:TonB-dependent receptor [Rhodospirillaceae bacterium]